MDKPVLYKLGFATIGLLFVIYGLFLVDMFVKSFVPDNIIAKYLAPVMLILSIVTIIIGIYALSNGSTRVVAMSFVLMSIPFLLTILPTYVTSADSLLKYTSYITAAVGIILLALAVMKFTSGQKMGAIVLILAAVSFVLPLVLNYIDNETILDALVYITTGLYIVTGVLMLYLAFMDRSGEVLED